MRQLRVTNMKCEGCSNKISNALKEAKISAIVDLPTKSVSVQDQDESKTREVITSLGYKVE